MELLEASVRVFVESLTTRTDLGDSTDALASDMLEVARRSGPDGLNSAVETLAKAFPLPFQQEGRAAIVLGALVELGADPMLAASALVQSLARVYEKAQQFASACEDAAEKADLDDVTKEIRQEIAQKFPEAAAAELALNNVSLGSLSVLTRSVEARELARHQPRLEMRARALAALHKGAHLVWVLLSVLEDDELLVLHPATTQGWRVRIHGVSDNRQLHLLLEDALLGGALPGEKPNPDAVRSATDGDISPSAVFGHSAWTLYQWRALRANQPLPADPAALAAPHLAVPRAGVPAEIDQFEGVRVVVLGPVVKPMTWNANRTFHELHASAQVTETLSPAMAEDWIQRIGSAQR